MSGQDGIDAIRSKQGLGDGSLDPNFHADQLQEVYNDTLILENGFTWSRKTSSYAVIEKYIRLDMFPAADDQVITLPNPANGNYQVDVFNQSATANWDIIINDFSGSEVTRIPANSAFSFFQNASAPTGDSVQITGVAVPALSIVDFGDFNNINYEKLPTSTATIEGTGSQFSNYPTDYILDPTTPYICTVNTVNTLTEYNQIITFTSSFVVTDDTAIGRPAFRGGGNFGGAVATGWTPYGKLSDRYPPENTGANLSRTSVVVYPNNITDSLASDDIDVFVPALQNNNNLFPRPAYDTGALFFDPLQMKFTNVLANEVSITLTWSGIINSSSTANNAYIAYRLNSTSGPGTGSFKELASGPTPGSTTARISLECLGAFTLTPGQSVWLEVSKSVLGTLTVSESLLVVTLIY